MTVTISTEEKTGGRMRTAQPVPRPARLSRITDVDILTFAARERAGGVALCTLVHIDGAFSRPLGAQLAVARDGRYLGHISGGCLETAAAGEALKALAEGRNRRVRYGSGSPFWDVRLPCGGGIEIYIDANPDVRALTRAGEAAGARRPFSLAFDPQTDHSDLSVLEADERVAGPSSETPDLFLRPFEPCLRLVLAGRGPELVALARLALANGCAVHGASPDELTLAECAALGATTQSLDLPSAPVTLPSDPWTAVVVLFHDHDWEPALLKSALGGKAFYIGALGSRRTHAARLDILKSMGVPDGDRARLRGPIGLIPSVRDPETLAVSTLAEILSVQRAAAET